MKTPEEIQKQIDWFIEDSCYKAPELKATHLHNETWIKALQWVLK